ncbi:MAG: hypothetical protein M1832_006459 [Thelocarpon impressellum]|nr:MAG: hypothetical protein M1832_006459 [Thelocarpon impressellum]
MASKALAFKKEGNKRFEAGDYKGAESLYTQAIVADPSNYLLFTNRAFARLRLKAWDEAINDCLKSIELHPTNMKAYYYLAQAQIQLHHPNEGLSSAMTAYDLCLSAGGSSSDASSVSALVLRARKEKWEARETERLRRRSALLAELEDRLELARLDDVGAIELRAARGGLGAQEAKEEMATASELSSKKLDELRSVFALADPDNLQRREVPDYLIDNISFSIMHDPVVASPLALSALLAILTSRQTKNGQSYDRATILEHLRRSETDPLTREPLRANELRTNVALKQACAAFLEENGWAVDW